MKKNQVAWLNNNSDLRTKSRQFQLAKQQLSSSREQADAAEQEDDEVDGFETTPVFNDPRCHRDRRSRQSIFFSTFRDRRNEARRGVCSLDTNWWISRNYCESLTE